MGCDVTLTVRYTEADVLSTRPCCIGNLICHKKGRGVGLPSDIRVVHLKLHGSCIQIALLIVDGYGDDHFTSHFYVFAIFGA